jgi:cell division protein FtsQ
MPREIEDADGDGPHDSRKGRFGAAPNPWWRPTGTWGRTILAFGVLTVLCAFAIAIHTGKTFLEHDIRFRIAGTSNIQATGLAEVNRSEILPVFGEDIGRNVFFVPLAERRRQLEQIPWVQHATVMRLLPDQIRVSVVERQPVAFVRHSRQIGLVDASGVLLEMPVTAMAQHHYSFPVLTGIDGGDPLLSRKARVDLYLRMMAELDSSGQRLSDQISEIDITDPEDARVLMPEQGSDILAHFGEDHFLDRYQRYKAHIAEWRQQYPKLAAVDLRYDQQVVLQMAPGSSTDLASVPSGNAKFAASQPAPPVAVAAKPAAATVKPPAAVVKADPPKHSPVSATAKADPPKPATPPVHSNELIAEAKHASAPVHSNELTAEAKAPEKTPAKTPSATETAKAKPASTPSSKAKPVATQTAKATQPKPAKSSNQAKPHIVASAKAAPKTKTAQQTKEERVKALAEKMRKKREAQAKRATLQKDNQKPPTKPHAPATGQGQ